MFTKETALKICDERGISIPQHRAFFVEGYQSGYVDGWTEALKALTKLLDTGQKGKPSIPDVEIR